MTHISNIVVPVDFSQAARNAVRLAGALALKFGATLTATHIVPSFAAFNYAFPGDVQEFEKKAFDEARKLLPEEIPQAFRDRLHTRTVVKAGEVRDELLGIVGDEKADLVVMGTHGRRGVERFFLGSTTENMLRRIPVPILTVSERGSSKHTESPFDPPFQRILYASDLSEASIGGLRYCGEFARTVGAHLSLLHVMELRDTTAFGQIAEVRNQLSERLKSSFESSGCAGMDVTTTIAEGTPHTEILKYAEQIHADLIVLNLQSKSMLERALLGSTAERVIRSAAVPVLSIPRR
jgi:nucleotide-binding universal stress UspA family protein